MNTPSPARPSTAQVALGLLIVGQILFLLATNVLPFLKDLRTYLKENRDDPDVESSVQTIERTAPGWTEGKGHAADAQEVAGGLTRRWGQATGQGQNWSLFAPTVADVTPFPKLELRWDDDPLGGPAQAARLAPLAAADGLQVAVLASAAWRASTAPAPMPIFLFSSNEPRDAGQYLRTGRFRLRRYEGSISIALYRGSQDWDEVADDFRRMIQEHVTANPRPILAYLQWRWNGYSNDHPDLPPPRQVILHMRTYRIAPPGSEGPGWEGPEEYPVARWQPGAAWGSYYLPVEMYNPVSQRFESLLK